MMQMNSKSMKEFRDTLALWHIADFTLADKIVTKQKNVKNLRGLIESNEKMLADLKKGCKGILKTEADLKAEIKQYEAKIEAEDKQMEFYRDEQSKAIENGRKLVPQSLVKAIDSYMSDIYSGKTEVAVLTEMVQFFVKNGATDCKTSDAEIFLKAIGLKKNSARSKVVTKKHNGTQNKVTTIDILLGAICDEPHMNALLPIHKFENVIEKKVSKQTNK